MTKTKKEVSEKSLGTRNIILAGALEMINRDGAHNFRIDNLANALNLSPGNITYHFSKKDDICALLWSRMLEKLDIFDKFTTDLLDIKQTFIIIRAVNALLWEYRGVVMARICNDDCDNGTSVTDKGNDFFKKAHAILRKNGYMKEADNELMERAVLDSECMMLRSWLNFQEVSKDTQHPIHDDKEEAVNKASLMVLYAMYPLFTDKAKSDFDEISDKVTRGEI